MSAQAAGQFTFEACAPVTQESSELESAVSTMTPITPVSSSQTSAAEEDTGSSVFSGDNELQRFKLLTDIYDTIESIELEDELLLSYVDGPVNFEQAVKDEA